MAKKTALKRIEAPKLIKLDFGCGKRPKEGFEGVDERDFGQPHKVDLRKPWPWADASVEEAFSSHFIEHLKPIERVHFVNELHRVLIPGGKCQVVFPHWASNRAYGDLTHQWPPMSEFWFYYLSKQWRDEYAPHNDFYACDFECTWGYSMNPAVSQRAQDYQQHAIQNFKDAIYDIVATLTKR